MHILRFQLKVMNLDLQLPTLEDALESYRFVVLGPMVIPVLIGLLLHIRSDLVRTAVEHCPRFRQSRVPPAGDTV